MTRTVRTRTTPAADAGVVVVALIKGHKLVAGNRVRARRHWVHLVGTSHVTQAGRTVVDVINTKGHFGAVYLEDITEVGFPHRTGKRDKCWCALGKLQP